MHQAMMSSSCYRSLVEVMSKEDETWISRLYCNDLSVIHVLEYSREEKCRAIWSADEL